MNMPIPLSRIKAKISADLDRKIKFRERLNILHDSLKPVVLSQLAYMFSPETFEDMKNYVDVSNNLAKRICSELSIVYKEEPNRKVTPKSPDKRYQEIQTQMRLNDKMGRVNFYLNGLNDLILFPAIYGNRIDLNILTPDKVTVFEDEDDPTMIEALAIEDFYYNEQGKKITLYYFWSPLEHYILDENFNKQYVFGNEQGLNPYWEFNKDRQSHCFYPFIAAHNTPRCHSFWDETTGMDLFEATKSIAIKNSFIYFMFPMQFKQMAIQNEGIDTGQQSVKNPQIKSPLHVMQTNGQTQVLDWQSQLVQLKEIVESQLYQVGSNYGISAENFKLTAVETSGFARMIAKERLLEIRANQVKNYREIEAQIFLSSAIANNLYQLGSEISESSKFSIDFKEPGFPSDPSMELDVLQKKISLGMTNILDEIKKQNPDIKTDDEAEAELDRNIQIRNKVQSKFSGLISFQSQSVNRGDKADANDE